MSEQLKKNNNNNLYAKAKILSLWVLNYFIYKNEFVQVLGGLITRAFAVTHKGEFYKFF